MKKTGFTLSEVIIALGIIGVIAAITSPMLGSIIPDKKKVAVLKVYKTVTDINQDLLSSPALYYVPSGTSQKDKCIGLACTAKPLAPEYSDIAIYPAADQELFSGNSKYMRLLASRLKTTSINIAKGASTGSFTTEDGYVWNFTAERSFSVDIDPKGKNCSASSSCKNPDQFKFKVDERGKVEGDDVLTTQYLANPYKLNDKRADYKGAGLIK